MIFDDLVQEYKKTDPAPEKPKRVWVNIPNGKATKAGEKWIKDFRDWEIRCLGWVYEKLKGHYENKDTPSCG